MSKPLRDVRFHPEAQAEYESARRWYAVRDPRVAERFEAEVERSLQLIAEHPTRFGRYDAEHRFVILQRFPYSLVYLDELSDDQVVVTAVPHHKQRPRYWKDRR